MKLPLLGKTVADFCEQVADPFDQSLVLIEIFALSGVVSYHHNQVICDVIAGAWGEKF